jgi:hypothetical protein
MTKMILSPFTETITADGSSNLVSSNPTGTTTASIINENFESGASVNLAVGSQLGGTAAVNLVAADNYANSVGSLKVNYPASGAGGVFAWANGDVFPINNNASEVYVQFKAKMPSVSKQGLKFCKIFGRNSGSNYANATFNLDYADGKMSQVIYGDGTAVTNDAQNAVRFDGAAFSVGRSYPSTAVIPAPQGAPWAASNWGTTWHDFKFHIKFNSGTTALNEVADGKVYVEIDGVVYADASGLFNRHYSNGPINYVGFFNWTQGGTVPFEVWIDNVIISEGGFQ